MLQVHGQFKSVKTKILIVLLVLQVASEIIDKKLSIIMRVSRPCQRQPQLSLVYLNPYDYIGHTRYFLF